VIELVAGLPKNVVGISVRGRLTMQDCRDVLMPAMRKSLKYHDKVRLYYELGSRFPGAAWDDLDLGLAARREPFVFRRHWPHHGVDRMLFGISAAPRTRTAALWSGASPHLISQRAVRGAERCPEAARGQPAPSGGQLRDA